MKKFVILILLLILTSCSYRLVPSDQVPAEGWMPGSAPGMNGGTAWGAGSFDSNGEQIYFTAINQSGERIRYQGGQVGGMMMGGYLACASCHGPDGRGGIHTMHMQIMDAPDIRWSHLVSEELEESHADDEHGEAGEYGFEQFRRAVVEGEHPDGEPLSDQMPRWQISDQDLQDLMGFLQSLP